MTIIYIVITLLDSIKIFNNSSYKEIIFFFIVFYPKVKNPPAPKKYFTFAHAKIKRTPSRPNGSETMRHQRAKRGVSVSGNEFKTIANTNIDEFSSRLSPINSQSRTVSKSQYYLTHHETPRISQSTD